MDPEQQARFTETIRQKFADEAPKRPLKPSRSDDSSVEAEFTAAAFSYDGPIPEYIKFEKLVRSSPEGIFCKLSTEGRQDFVETKYYEHLRAADQSLHHTTGTGFIQVHTNGSFDLNAPSKPSVLKTKVSGNARDVELPEEFVETEYYNDLNAVDQSLHHTTGTGLIQVEKCEDFHIDFARSTTLQRIKSRCNPATNDWIPAEDFHIGFAEDSVVCQE
ncbi:hypothetical protein KP509_01G125700 [Ceratopteris richardii]|uniref:Uncharacterized protein n=1 Tax=Ceratopteris richardii TaxID=49495 RepID=A0A8T2VLC9_CERRI|nr:hypothetical protein KP509_01G125700 [Ceratopteris richardii]